MFKKISPYLFFVLALLPVCWLRDFTPDNELRYLSIADEALREGNFFTFSNHGVPYADKPPLYFWIVMLGKQLMGSHKMIFLALFSLIPALLTLRVMDKWTGSRSKWALLTSGLFLGLAVFLRMDMLMVLFIVLSLYTFYEVYSNHTTGWNGFLFPIYVFLALFSKGPVGILVPLLATIAFLLVMKQGRLLGRFWGWKTWIVLALGCLIWFGGAYLEGGKAYLDNLLVHQTVDRAVNAFHHKEPFYYYTYMIWGVMLPWSLLYGAVILYGLCKKWNKTPLEKLFLTIIAVTFLMLSAFSSKLAVYLLPIIPFVSVLGMMWLDKIPWNRWLSLTLALPAVLFLIALPAFPFVVRDPSVAYLNHWLFYAAAGLLTLGGGGALWLLYKRRAMEASLKIMAVALLLAVFVGGWGMPRMNPYIGCGEACRMAVQLAQEKAAPGFCSVGMNRSESLDVYLQEDIVKLEPSDVSDPRYAGHILLVPERFLAKNPNLQQQLHGMENYLIGNHFVFVLSL